MQGNDIVQDSYLGQGVIFEGVLITLSDTLISKFHKQRGNWEKYLSECIPHELPLKAMIDSSVRLGVSTEVYTFMDSEAVEAIDKWLLKKGISVAISAYNTVEELAYDLKFQRSIRTVYVETQEQALAIGLRAHVVDQKKAWIV